MTIAARWSAAGQTEFTLARAVVLFRVAGLAEIAIVAGHNASGYRGHGAVVMALLAAIAVESAVLCPVVAEPTGQLHRARLADVSAPVDRLG